MGLFDIYRYLNERTPMGRAAIVSAEVSDAQRAKTGKWLRDHGHPDGADEERCWYCGERDATGVVGLVLQKGVVQQHRESMTVPVPSCAECRELFVSRARAATRAHHAGFLVAFAGVIALIAAFGEAPKDWIKAIFVGFLLTFFAAGVVGSLLGWIPVRAGAGKTSRLKSELDYPKAKPLLQDGWRPM
jgi:hypothetical protein